MPFVDVIDNYANGASGTLTTSDGGSVSYVVTGNVNTISRTGTDLGAQVTGDGLRTVQVAFGDTVHGVTISVNRSNPGEVYFVQIDGVTINLNTAVANGTVEFSQAGASTHFITGSGGISSTGDPANGSIGFLHFQSPVNTVRIFGTGGGSGNFDLFDIGIDSLDFKIVCFEAETLIATPRGPVRAGSLTVGDLVETVDNGASVITHRMSRRISAVEQMREARLSPVRIRAGALGQGLPDRDLLVSRQHRVLVASRIAARILKCPEFLTPAIRLVGLPGIEIDRSCRPVEYVHLLLNRHEILLANGAPAESLYTGPGALGALELDGVQEGYPLLLGRNRAGNGRPDMEPARPFPDARQVRKVVASHLRQGRPLLEGYRQGGGCEPVRERA